MAYSVNVSPIHTLPLVTRGVVVVLLYSACLCVSVCVWVCFCLCVIFVFFTDCRIHLFSSLAARLFNKLTRYSLLTRGDTSPRPYPVDFACCSPPLFKPGDGCGGSSDPLNLPGSYAPRLPVIGRWSRAAPADSENISNLWSLSSSSENNRPIGAARRRRNFNTAPSLGPRDGHRACAYQIFTRSTNWKSSGCSSRNIPCIYLRGSWTRVGRSLRDENRHFDSAHERRINAPRLLL